MDFKILIDSTFLPFNTAPDLAPIENKNVVSLVNDFEDGKWRFTKFQNFIWDNIAETALSHKERESLVNKNHSALTAAARNLRLTDKEQDIGKGSELAEIVLYGIMKHHYRALPVVPKIFYKQNSQDNAKGADSVHIVVNNESDFTIWFGEAKFLSSIENSRLPEIIKSVENSLNTEKLKKENSIVTNLPELDALIISDDLKSQIKKALSPANSIDHLKAKLHIPILLLHECAITREASEVDNVYLQKIIDHHKERAQAYFSAQINKLKGVHKYGEITFHLILIPVPCKKTIVDKFISNVEHYKEDN